MNTLGAGTTSEIMVMLYEPQAAWVKLYPANAQNSHAEIRQHETVRNLMESVLLW
jgi:hypothetical protein